MRNILLALILISLALTAKGESQANISTQTAAAKTAIKQFAGELQTELKTAMQAGGPVAAIGVCNTQAMPITARVAAQHKMQLSRVSLKPRNPVNAPNAWQTTVLEDFERDKAAGRDITMLAWSETVNVDGKQEFRFMKAIPTGEVCLKCHGTTLAPGVSPVLADLYPEDRATGYSVGDIRGAFVVTREID